MYFCKSIIEEKFAEESNDCIVGPVSFCLETGIKTKLNLTKIKLKGLGLGLNLANLEQTGARGWNKVMPMEVGTWKIYLLYSATTLCKEMKLWKFQFQFLHRIIVSKKELSQFGTKIDNNCLYCSESDSINHTFTSCIRCIWNHCFHVTNNYLVEILCCLLQEGCEYYKHKSTHHVRISIKT